MQNLVDFDPDENEPRAPELVEVRSRGDGERYTLHAGDNWIGYDEQACNILMTGGSRSGIVLTGDRTVSPRHARLFTDENGQWNIEDAQSQNGVWVRVQEGKLDNGSEFQLGEQRFLLTIY